MKSKIVKIGIIVIVVILLFVAYSFVKKDKPQGTLSSSERDVAVAPIDSTSSAAVVGNELLGLLLSLNQLQLDDSVFSSPVFQGLEDISIVLPPEDVKGRSNPFAPIGSDSIVIIEDTADEALPEEDATPDDTPPADPPPLPPSAP